MQAMRLHSAVVSPNVLSAVQFSFRVDSRLKHAGMTEKHWQPKEELEKTEQ